MTLFEAYAECNDDKRNSDNNYRGRMIYRKATGLIVKFASASSPRTNSVYPFPTVEDMEADDWFPVVIGTVQNTVMN